MPKFENFATLPLTRVKDWIEKIPPASMNSQTSHPANHFHVAAAPLNGKHSRNEFTKPSSRWFRVKCFRVDFTRFRRTTPTKPWKCKSSGWWSFQFWTKYALIPRECCVSIWTKTSRDMGSSCASCIKLREMAWVVWEMAWVGMNWNKLHELCELGWLSNWLSYINWVSCSWGFNLSEYFT